MIDYQPPTMTEYPDMWKAPYSWEEIKAITLFGYFMGGEGIFMVTEENPHLPYFYGYAVGVLRNGELECSRTYAGSFDKDSMHSKASEGRGFLTRKYDDALIRWYETVAGIEALKEAFREH